MDSKTKALNETAAALEINPATLNSLVFFESGDNPQARNPITGARGLLQWLHSTAREMGFLSADDLVLKYPTYEKQMKVPVYNYLKKYKPFTTKQSLYMAVFYPAARSWPETALFPEIVRKQNPGIDTVADYINFVEKKGSKKKARNTATTAIIFLIITTALYFFTKKKKGKTHGREKKAIE